MKFLKLWSRSSAEVLRPVLLRREVLRPFLPGNDEIKSFLSTK